ncbi:MAG: toxin-antitoxin system HicB family antitoxin [Anaerolineae bacterium]|nr:toxin-antitoxin system HicB family antitoxin [Anaerolineae bacterium]
MGRLTLRLPDTLHQQLASLAEQEGMSLNQFIVYALTRHVASASATRQQEIVYTVSSQSVGKTSREEIHTVLSERKATYPEHGAEVDTIFSLPVSLEQISLAIRRMSREEQRRLLDLAPDLREAALQVSTRTESQAREAMARLQEELRANLGGELLSPEEPFLGNMTLGEYLALPEEEKRTLWEAWEGTDLMELDEREVSSDALPAR